MSSISTASGSQFYGSRMYAIDNIKLAAAAEGIEGIAAHADGDIHLASNNAMGLCHADPNGVVRDQNYPIVD